MISHVVLMKPRVDLAPADRRAFAEAFRRAVEAIPTVRSVRIGQRVRHGAGYEASSGDTADYLAVIDFDDLGGLQAYLAHPAYEELGARFSQSLSAASVYDFEVGGLDTLSRLR
ncbi:MAG TPA: Dabb family protein [Gemmatimonadales bacterium]|nr:Dabb family protein [Gemmatimonadales bacterium]